MAAYAALLSLLNIIDQIQNHPRLSTALNKNHTESLSERIDFLLHFIESYSSHFEDLESQIVSTAHAIEDIIESHIVDQILDGSIEKNHTCLLDLQKVIADMDAIKEEAMKVKEERQLKDQQPAYSIRVPSSRPHVASKTSMVGFDDYLIQLMDVLTGHQRSRQIISIVGMGGTGKTTLARNVYEHMVVTQHFDIRAWTTISQEYSVREILLELLSCKDESTSETDDVLGERLYKHLFGRRYLLILDDMWSTEVWDKMKFFFPDNGNGSRIVITTRISNMAFSCSSFSFEMNFLNEDNSWKLFCEKAFGEEDCPDELVNIGKMIVEQCRGLPLSIVVIGGHLRKSSRTREHWENVANDMKSILNSGEDEQCLNILSLSYTHLPVYLKPCFLYMGIFPEDEEIRVSRLIKLWIAEGFLRPYENQSLEEVAKEYLKDLVDRNLILVRQWSQNEKIRTCSIHDLLREVCLKVAEKEKFLCVLKSVDNPRPLYSDCRVAVHGGLISKNYSPDGNFYWYPRVFDALCSAPFVRSLICNAWHLSFDFLKLMRILDRVHDTVDIYDVRHLAAKFQQVNLRYLDREFWWGRPRDDMDPYPRLFLPSSISRLWSLQTLIIRGIGLQFFAPREIWELPMLRHLLVSSSIYLPNPPPSDQQDVLILRNLQTLSRLANFKLSDEVCKRIPNIKKLRIWYDFESNPSSYYNFNNLGHFHELESLSCGFADESDWCDFSLSLTLPCSLRKVSLTHCFLDWKDLTIFSSLPYLEVLKLEFGRDAMGHEWNPIAGGFPRLKSLMIWASNLIYWNADNSHFPVLKNLTLRYVSKLDVFPSGIGEIPTLRRITLVDCSVSASISAMKMLVEQEELGNDGFLLDVEIWDQQNAESFKEMVRKEGLKSNNIRLDIGRPYSRMQEDDADI